MRQEILLLIGGLITITLLNSSSCNKYPYKPDYKNITGFVIGKETCNTDEAKDYWIIDFTLRPNQPQIGDTLNLNGIEYTNVMKVKGLDDDLKQIGMKVSIDYDNVTPNKFESTGCSVTRPATYLLKELYIIYQGEIR